MMNSPKKWSAEQAAFLNWAEHGKGSCVLRAVAGSGKTTTIIEAAAHRMRGCSAMLAYNNKIAAEIKGKLSDLGVDWKAVRSGTVHSFGMTAMRKAVPNVDVKGDKVANIAKVEFADHGDAYRESLCSLVSMAKQRAIGVTCGLRSLSDWHHIIEHYDIQFEGPQDVDTIILDAIKLLKLSNEVTSIIDFDDMIYLPLVMKLRFWTYDNVFIDEAQDTNPARRELCKRLLKPRGRLIAVGDDHQAIYGFTGADNDSLDIIEAEFNAIRMPLSVSFRCPRAVVEFVLANGWHSHIEAAQGAADGSVGEMPYTQLFKAGLGAGDAILCRLTAPLMATAFYLIRSKIPCRVEGRDVGKGLIKLMTKWKVKTIAQFDGYLAKHRTRMIEKLADKPRALQMILDQCDTVAVILSECRIAGEHSIDAAVSRVNALFADDVSNVVVLSTIHKSKGREWQRVVWLDRHMTTFAMAGMCTREWQLAQETNLLYVAATRSQSQLFDCTSPTRKRD